MSAKRLLELGKEFHLGMARAVVDLQIDWTRNSSEIAKAQENLDEVVTTYYEGGNEKADVRRAYQRWRDLHKSGGLFT